MFLERELLLVGSEAQKWQVGKIYNEAETKIYNKTKTADVPIRPNTKTGDFLSCNLGSQVDAKNGGLFGERPTGRGENNYFTVGQRPQVKTIFCIA